MQPRVGLRHVIVALHHHSHPHPRCFHHTVVVVDTTKTKTPAFAPTTFSPVPRLPPPPPPPSLLSTSTRSPVCLDPCFARAPLPAVALTLTGSSFTPSTRTARLVHHHHHRHHHRALHSSSSSPRIDNDSDITTNVTDTVAMTTPSSCSSRTGSGSVIHWFRRDLRLHDNRTLSAAISFASTHSLPLHLIFILDSHAYGRSLCGSTRLRFLCDCLSDLSTKLSLIGAANSNGLRLHVLRSSGDTIADVATTLRRVAKRVGARRVFAQSEHDARERALERLLSSKGEEMEFVFVDGFTLVPPDVLVNAAGGSVTDVPLTMRGFLNLFDQSGKITVRQPVPFPTAAAAAVASLTQKAASTSTGDGVVDGGHTPTTVSGSDPDHHDGDDDNDDDRLLFGSADEFPHVPDVATIDSDPLIRPLLPSSSSSVSTISDESVSPPSCPEEAALRRRLAFLRESHPGLLAACSIIGGETEALKRMAAYLARDNGRAARNFSKPDTSPASFGTRDAHTALATTGLSAHLAMGSLSPRLLYHSLPGARGGANGNANAMTQTSLRGQLLWREHFWLCCHTQLAFEDGGWMCTTTTTTTTTFDNDNNEDQKHKLFTARPINWDNDETLLRAWRFGATGYPWIDALMTQLHATGWVHHLGRHSLACFLTRGDLWQSWTVGRDVFHQLLVDHDHALNAANWMWLSCSAFFHMFRRVYSPVAFARKWDVARSDGVDERFVQMFLPEMRNVPTRFVHEPWTAPREVLRGAGCKIVKRTVGNEEEERGEKREKEKEESVWLYPARIVVHEDVVKTNLDRMKHEFERCAQLKRQHEAAAQAEATAGGKKTPAKTKTKTKTKVTEKKCKAVGKRRAPSPSPPTDDDDDDVESDDDNDNDDDDWRAAPTRTAKRGRRGRASDAPKRGSKKARATATADANGSGSRSRKASSVKVQSRLTKLRKKGRAHTDATDSTSGR